MGRANQRRTIPRRQQRSKSAKKASRVIPAVRIRFVMNVQAHFIVLRDDQRPCDAQLLQLKMTAALAGLPIAKLFKHANQLAPGKRRQPRRHAVFSTSKGTGMGN